MDWDTARTVALITFGHAIGGAILSAWYSWKAKRVEVKMVRNRKGVYVDAAEVFETRALIAIWVALIATVATGVALIASRL